ncbi:MAG: hypothetical protein QM305_09720 [Bacteroidota bacterium]|nr:hypothetical protein [Bacteroidota bacterium]
MRLTKEQRDVLNGMLGHFKTAYGFASHCDEEIDKALKLQMDFSDNKEVSFEEYDIISGRGSFIISRIMNLSRELNKEIKRIEKLLR